MLHNRPNMKQRRKELRNNAPPAEQRLWHMLKHRSLAGYKFRRQHSIGSYVVDFYCPAQKLGIELDGDTHYTPDAIRYDKKRTAFLNAHGIHIIRFLNTDIYQNPAGVCEKILQSIRELPRTTP